MKKNLFDIEYLSSEGIKLLPVITALVFILGYIGFHTFTSIYHLPIYDADLSIIAGIGLLNMAYIAILYFFANAKRKPRFTLALSIYFIFNFFLNNPITISSLLIINVMLLSLYQNRKRETPNFNIRRKRVLWYNRLLWWGDLLITISGLIVSSFFDADFYGLVILIYFLLYSIHLYKRKTNQIKFLTLIIVLLFPVISMKHFINSSRLNILGINSIPATIITENDSLSVNLIFNDENYFYTYSDTTKKVMTIPKKDVKKMTTNTEKIDKEVGFIVIRKMFE